MAKQYTAQEMRTTADFMCADITFARVPVQYKRPLYRDVKTHEVADMLRQAADMIERGENVLKANAKHLGCRHKDADAALAYANYILRGDAGKEES